MSVKRSIIRVVMRGVSIPLAAMSVSVRNHSTLIILWAGVFLKEMAGVVMDSGRRGFGGQNNPAGLAVIILKGILSIQANMAAGLDIPRVMDGQAAVTMVLLDRDSMVNLDIQVNRALQVFLVGQDNLEDTGRQLKVQGRLFVLMKIFTQATGKEVIAMVMDVQVILVNMVGLVTMEGLDIQVNLDVQDTTVDPDRRMEGAEKLMDLGVDMMYLAQMVVQEALDLVATQEHQDTQVTAQDYRPVKMPGPDIQAKTKDLAIHKMVKMEDLGTQDIQASRDIQPRLYNQEEDIQTILEVARFQVTMTMPDQEDIQAQFRVGHLECLVLEAEMKPEAVALRDL